MKKQFLFLWLLTFCFGLAQAQARSFLNSDSKGLMIEGYDPVSYFKASKPMKGKPEFEVKQNDVTYRFATEANRAEFLKDPKKYEPQFGGWCAFAVADSKAKVEVDPDSFLIQDGRLLLFYNGFLSDTRKKWTTTKDKDPKAFLKQADANWPAIQSKEP